MKSELLERMKKVCLDATMLLQMLYFSKTGLIWEKNSTLYQEPASQIMVNVHYCI